MPKPKLGTIKDGKPLHYSVGAVIEHEGKYLLIDRAHPPFGFASPAGHVDVGENADAALIREIQEEVGLTITHFELLFEEDIYPNICGEGVETHHWYVYRCTVTGEPRREESETKSMGWYSPEEMRQLQLEPVWQHWFEKLGVL